MFHPSRGGVRGGADQFEWEDVKVDKHRECYLGHSLKAPVGRWQKGKDLQWYTRGAQGGGGKHNSSNEEKDAIRRMEAEMLAAALGKGPMKKPQTSLTKQELAEVCQKGQLERDSMDIERVEGMGFGRTRASLVDHVASPMKETMAASASRQDPLQVKSTRKAKQDSSGENERSKRSKHKQGKKQKKEKKKKKKRHRSSDSSDQEKGSKGKRRRHDSESDTDGKDHLQERQEKVTRKRHDSDSEDDRTVTQRKVRDHRDHHSRFSRNLKGAKKNRGDASDSDDNRQIKHKYRKEKWNE